MKLHKDRKRNAPVGFGLKDFFFKDNDNKCGTHTMRYNL